MTKTGMIGAFDYYEGFGQRYTHKEYPADLILQRKFIDDESWGLINRHVQKAGIAANNLMETQAADVFNNGFSTSYNWGDGKPLFSADHPANSAGSAPTGNNVNALALSYNNINSVINSMRKFTDDQGNILGVVPDTILVPVELYQEAVEVLRATGKPQNQAFNQASSFSGPDIGPLRIISWEYLTDAQHWFVMDSAMAKMSLHLVQSRPLRLDRG